MRAICYTLCHELPELHGFGARERATLLDETVSVCGRTGLLLSGGGLLGIMHTGTVIALHAAGLLPRVISGSSAGAIVAAVVCTRTEEELVQFGRSWLKDDSDPATRLFLRFFGSAGPRRRFKNLIGVRGSRELGIRDAHCTTLHVPWDTSV